MRIHICDTRSIPGHGCCGGFVWPEEIQVLCGKTVAFRPVRAESPEADEKRFCRECLRKLRNRSVKHDASICTILE